MCPHSKTHMGQNESQGESLPQGPRASQESLHGASALGACSITAFPVPLA